MDKLNRRKAILDGVPENKKKLFERAFSGKSKAAGIKAKCFDCMNFENASTRIRECSSYSCPIHDYRPFRPKDAKQGLEKTKPLSDKQRTGLFGRISKGQVLDA